MLVRGRQQSSTMAELSESSLDMLVDKNLAGDICAVQILKAGCIFCLFCICIKVRIISTVFRGLVQLANTFRAPKAATPELCNPNPGEGRAAACVTQPMFHGPCFTQTARFLQE